MSVIYTEKSTGYIPNLKHPMLYLYINEYFTDKDDIMWKIIDIYIALRYNEIHVYLLKES